MVEERVKELTPNKLRSIIFALMQAICWGLPPPDLSALVGLFEVFVSFAFFF
jgi:hypothetical protein